MDILLAREYYNSNRIDDALEMAKHYRKAHGFDVAWSELEAFSLQKSGKFEEAMQIWNVLIATEPKAGFFLERGVCKFNLGFKSALEDFDAALQMDSNNAYFHAAKAYILDKKGRLSEAVEHYTIAINLEPDNEITLNNLAITEQKRGNMSRAEELFRATDSILKDKGLMPERTYNPEPETREIKPEKLTISGELKKMLGSRQGFMAFISDAKKLFGKKR